ncbi:hypothetical protein EK21DRAFT_90680 [Setomelanomma holmii]|uniref:DUF7779 domain-containing protein n=1 Tax=Setomelanomma holmii TaxID=210430 RepID=A0A9P4LLW5_9PLEO|nr:hypothetical protein EK21DRAFT_90680 [Setomelanomma holmii]
MPQNDELEKITNHFDHVLGRLTEAVDQIRELAGIALSKAQKEEVDRMKRLQEANMQGTDGDANLPYPTTGLKSVNIFGMGEVGKSQVSLHYALSHLNGLDAILWFHCESLKVAEESFSDAAAKLRFPEVKWNNHVDNRWRALSWLEQTLWLGSRWLFIYDNVESKDIINKYWPATTKGRVIITSRKHAFAIQHSPFSLVLGAEYIRNNAGADLTSDADKKSSEELCKKLNGHPLALAQISALAEKRTWKLDKLLTMYKKSPKKLHGLSDPALLHAGYTLSVSTVFRMSFLAILHPDSNSPGDVPLNAQPDQKGVGAILLLGVMSFLDPDAVEEGLLVLPYDCHVPDELEFLKDDFDVSEQLDILVDVALVQKNKATAKLSVHRLVQAEFRYFTSPADRQLHFEAASRILYEVLPRQSDERFGPRILDCDKVIKQVCALRDNICSPPPDLAELQPTDEFCKLTLLGTASKCTAA